MSRISISGFALITERADGIWIMGLENDIIQLMNLKTLQVSNICLYYKDDSPYNIIKFFSTGFNSRQVDTEVVETKFDTVKVEINLEKNELYFI